MELGEKIRQARLEAGLSQRQLCGEEITRNMLSLIENGAARPSMKTLGYLAKQLGKPLSWFVDEQAPDHGQLLSSVENLRLAEDALAQGKDIYAAPLLEQVTSPLLQRARSAVGMIRRRRRSGPWPHPVRRSITRSRPMCRCTGGCSDCMPDCTMTLAGTETA